MGKKKVKVSDDKMNSLQGTVISVLTRLKRRRQISHFSIERNNPLINTNVNLFQGKSKKITFNVTESNMSFNEVRKVIVKKIY